MSTGLIKKIVYSGLTCLIVTVVVTSGLEKEVEFSLFVGIPAGLLAGIFTFWAQIRS